MKLLILSTLLSLANLTYATEYICAVESNTLKGDANLSMSDLKVLDDGEYHSFSKSRVSKGNGVQINISEVEGYIYATALIRENVSLEVSNIETADTTVLRIKAKSNESFDMHSFSGPNNQNVAFSCEVKI